MNMLESWRGLRGVGLSDDQLLTPHLLSSLISPSLFALLYFLFLLAPSPCNFFVQRIKFHLRGLWERRPSDWPLPVQMLWIYGAFLPPRRSEAGTEGWMDGAALRGERLDGLNGRGLGGLWGAGEQGGETCLYFLGIRRQMGALRGGLRSRPPWMAGKLTPIWLCGLYCALPACRPGTGRRPVHRSLCRPPSPLPYKVFTQNPTRLLNLLVMQEFDLLNHDSYWFERTTVASSLEMHHKRHKPREPTFSVLGLEIASFFFFFLLVALTLQLQRQHISDVQMCTPTRPLTFEGIFMKEACFVKKNSEEASQKSKQ